MCEKMNYDMLEYLACKVICVHWCNITHFRYRSTTLYWNPLKPAVITFLGALHSLLMALGYLNIFRVSVLAYTSTFMYYYSKTLYGDL
ncbi:hypothetical protein M405DRAFT_290402 [Rhizopogon salebrosus TDB-379]|nr:hypothetical protein M405DRAFT_290402 [Rhizopogon salebrosus TDB-379]